MSNNSTGEKTEQPTPKKERDARKKGQVARSQEVVTTASLMTAIAYLWFMWGAIFDRLVAAIDQITALYTVDFQTAAFLGMAIVFNEGVAIIAPLLVVVIVAGIFANYLQFGTIFAGNNVAMKLENISPMKGFKRIFSMKQLFEVFKSILKIVLLSVLLFIVVRDALGPYLNTVACGMVCIIDVTAQVMAQTLLWSALAFVIVAVLDFMFQRKQHTKSLMMTKEEVKREFKESEGDPIIKGQRKQLAQELAMSDGGERAKKSTAVVINPTHFAVAIQYDPDVNPLPIVVAKGRNLYAHFLRGQAESAGVPIFRNVPLTRSLFADTDVDQYVPDELFDVVAEILIWVSHNKSSLYQGPLDHGVIDMEMGDHRVEAAKKDQPKQAFRFGS
ncbi:type III secretion system export apparatus subunit SctU [Yoonia sp. BS5-3]|uniref:Type III secretion system export apparatus subunit SctU n=1 Tax=Yoonia phaeophyticola TaxID=3137369 RepID=A0ABZ2V3W9_9RHOB